MRMIKRMVVCCFVMAMVFAGIMSAPAQAGTLSFEDMYEILMTVDDLTQEVYEVQSYASEMTEEELVYAIADIAERFQPIMVSIAEDELADDAIFFGFHVAAAAKSVEIGLFYYFLGLLEGEDGYMEAGDSMIEAGQSEIEVSYSYVN